MKKCSTCKEMKKLSEFGKNKSTKDGFQYQCRTCKAKSKKKWQDDNKKKVNEYRRNYAKTENGKNKVKAQSDKYRESDKGKGKLKELMSSQKYKDYRAKWKRESGEGTLRSAIKRANRLGAWNKDLLYEGERIEMRKLYKKSRELGEDYHVDHIIPYSGVLEDGREVVGLHRLKNLQILTKEENLEKSNKVSYSVLENFEENVHFILK